MNVKGGIPSKLLSKSTARLLWLAAQGLDRAAPFGKGEDGTERATQHLGYVQIDTINVIERCHHHILYSRVPDYARSHLKTLQSEKKSVFEYWTHALSYIPTRDFRYFMGTMQRYRHDPGAWLSGVSDEDKRKVQRLLKAGPLSIRDIADDVLVEKDHEWASRKPSKRALQLGFYEGRFVVSERQGMLKKYDLVSRHFGWDAPPKRATDKEVAVYMVERALRAQSLVSLDSICHLAPKRKPAVSSVIARLVQAGELVPVKVEDLQKIQFWVRPEDLDKRVRLDASLTHILSPFDPLIILRKRLEALFGYQHLFEAYVTPAKRTFGYFALPVIVEDRVVAVLDLKTDRQKRELLIQKWSWLPGGKSKAVVRQIEGALDRFEAFQLAP